VESTPERGGRVLRLFGPVCQEGPSGSSLLGEERDFVSGGIPCVCIIGLKSSHMMVGVDSSLLMLVHKTNP